MLNKRRLNYASQLNNGSLSILFSGIPKRQTADQYYPFSVNRNFYYLTNIDQPNSALLTIKDHDLVRHFLFIEFRDVLKAKWDGELLSLEEVSEKSGISVENIKDIGTFDHFLTLNLEDSRKSLIKSPQSIYLDLERHTFGDEETLSFVYSKKILNSYPALKIHNSYFLISELRKYKDQLEISKIQEAIKITDIGLRRVLNHLKPHLYEYQILAEYHYVLNFNCLTTSFTPIVASGENATILHYVENNSLLQENDLVLLDIGVEKEYLCSDISRTYPISGKFTKRQKEIYEVVLNANKKTIEWLKPGVTFKEFLDFGKNLLIKGAKEIGLIKEDSEITKYYYHGLGHYLGLDVHDVGSYNELFQEGMVITVEPGLYVAEEKIGIRIEDNVLITKDGAINLSKSIIKEIAEIENFMALKK